MAISPSAAEAEGKKTYGVRDVGEVNERALLLAKRVDELNLAVFAKVLAKALLVVEIKVINVADLRSSVRNVQTT